MSVYTAIYEKLSNDPELKAILSSSTFDPTVPAIYENWATSGTEKPYINLTYSFTEGFHWAKRNGTLFIDIFANDTVQAEAIRDRVWYTLDRELLESEKDGQVRLYAGNDNYTYEAGGIEDHAVHWELEFTVVYWRKNVIEKLNLE